MSLARKKPVKRETDDETSKRCKVKTDDDASKRRKEEKSPVRTTAKEDRRRGLKKTPEKSAQISPKKIEIPSAITTEQRNLKRKTCRTYTLSDDLSENAPLEEYIPDAPKTKRSCPDFKYVPSRKSTLESMRLTSNEYTPTLCDSKGCIAEDVSYVPNSVEKLETNYEVYEPRAITVVPDSVFEEYVPNSKGFISSIEKYEPDFKSPSKLMKFDDSYVPSSVRRSVPHDSKRTPNKLEKLKKLEARQKGMMEKKNVNHLFS